MALQHEHAIVRCSDLHALQLLIRVIDRELRLLLLDPDHRSVRARALAFDLLRRRRVILLRAREVLIDLGLDDLVAREDLRILLREPLLLIELVGSGVRIGVASRDAGLRFDLLARELRVR